MAWRGARGACASLVTIMNVCWNRVPSGDRTPGEVTDHQVGVHNNSVPRLIILTASHDDTRVHYFTGADAHLVAGESICSRELLSFIIPMIP